MNCDFASLVLAAAAPYGSNGPIDATTLLQSLNTLTGLPYPATTPGSAPSTSSTVLPVNMWQSNHPLNIANSQVAIQQLQALLNFQQLHNQGLLNSVAAADPTNLLSGERKTCLASSFAHPSILFFFIADIS
ncbi:unnamed protein product [Caenorhabditis auriculariae]|uniref:Uncharacterized protein n=1 Tax=Caenorhabditis auriculariae TaxID=2777116 RepID=A0A8S1HXS2_9PELO|nr:unnamed protein product [Caenorhabditis auriculariae]